MMEKTSTISGSPTRLTALRRGALLVLTTFASDWVAHQLTPSPITRSLLWPGPGIDIALLLLWGVGYWPAVLIGAFGYSLWFSGDLRFALSATGSLMVMVLVGVFWLRRRGVTVPLAGMRHLLDLMFVSAVLMPLFGATFMVVGIHIAGLEDGHPALVLEALGWLTITIGVLSSAPLVLTWSEREFTWSVPRALEALLLASGVVAVSILVYGGAVSLDAGRGLGYVAFPFLIWAALRFGRSGTALVASAVTLITLWGAAHGRGFLHQSDPVFTTLYADGFCVTLTATGLLIASAIHEARRSALALGKSEREYRLLNEQASDAIFVSGPEGRLLAANARATQLLGYSREEFSRLSVVDLIPPEDRLTHPPHEIREIGRPELFERRMRARDGTIRTVEVSATRLDDDRLQAIVRDVSERKRTEAELREALSMLEATLDSTTDGILVVDTQGRIRSFNRKFVELWALPDEVLASRDDERALAYVLDQLDNPEVFLQQVRHLYNHPEETSFDVLKFKDGRVYERYSQAHTIGGQVQGRVWSFRDVTQRLELETQLRHAQKMEAVGQLAGGVAHDFNNLLTAIMGHTSLLLARIELENPLREELGEIHRASERAALLTRQLLTFSRQQVLEPRVMDLNLFVRSMRQLLIGATGEAVRLELCPTDDPLWIRADSGQLEQVVLNLAINARDAMPAGGTLRFETGPVHFDADGEKLGVRPGEYARLTCRDNGVGMDEATRSRAFDPFFTTKERGRGTGLGLAAVYGIVKQTGGAVALESEPGQGARFDLYFPSVAEDPARREGHEHRDSAPGRRGRVLLVEDEDTVRALLHEALEAAGFEVRAVSHAQAALAEFGRNGPSPDLLVTDVVMPGMSGPALAEQLMGEHQGLRVLFISGYTSDELVNRLPFGSSVGFLQKPFSPPVLIQKIFDLLETPAGG